MHCAEGNDDTAFEERILLRLKRHSKLCQNPLRSVVVSANSNIVNIALHSNPIVHLFSTFITCVLGQLL
jgi:hypothetical protein